MTDGNSLNRKSMIKKRKKYLETSGMKTERGKHISRYIQ